MGTRGITEVIFEGKTVIAQYGQWDHYPSGQGLVAFKFLKSPGNIDSLINNLGLIYYPSTAELDNMYAPYTNENGMMTMDDGDRFNNDYPSLTRDTGARILEVIATATESVPIYLSDDFKDDALMCEGVYTVNLDDRTFTSYYNDEETTIPFSQLLSLDEEQYLEKVKCPVYAHSIAS